MNSIVKSLPFYKIFKIQNVPKTEMHLALYCSFIQFIQNLFMHFRGFKFIQIQRSSNETVTKLEVKK